MSAAATSRFVAAEASPAVARSERSAPGRIVMRVPCTRRRRWRPAGVRCGGASLQGGILGEDKVEEGGRFVGWFREAWPYIRGHRGSTFVVVISGEVIAGPDLDGILQVPLSHSGLCFDLLRQK
jgi:amino-acid N-acetyltransferase